MITDLQKQVLLGIIMQKGNCLNLHGGFEKLCLNCFRHAFPNCPSTFEDRAMRYQEAVEVFVKEFGAGELVEMLL